MPQIGLDDESSRHRYSTRLLSLSAADRLFDPYTLQNIHEVNSPTIVLYSGSTPSTVVLDFCQFIYYIIYYYIYIKQVNHCILSVYVLTVSQVRY